MIRSIASAATITVHGTGVYEITGTANISVINGMSDGDIIILMPAGAFGFSAPINTVTNPAVVLRPIMLVKMSGVVHEVNPSYISSLPLPVPIANGGTGQATALLAFNALSPLTTKGQLITNDGTNDVPLGIDTDGKVLMLDSTTAEGIKWSAAGGVGPQGPIGLMGPEGPEGAEGIQGPPGPQGVQGTTGSAGGPGATGATGPQGAPGVDGLDGIDGNDGPPGPTGAQGTAGSAGAPGAQGATGWPGVDGLDGVDGNDGPPGLQGSTGNAGATGSTGPAGPPGADGLDGEQGPPGAAGPQGPAGGGGGFTAFTKDLGVSNRSGTFDITGLSGLTAEKVVTLVQTAAQIASKGNARDEVEMDQIQLTGYVVDASTIRAYWQAPGVVVGTYAFAYQVSA